MRELEKVDLTRYKNLIRNMRAAAASGANDKVIPMKAPVGRPPVSAARSAERHQSELENIENPRRRIVTFYYRRIGYPLTSNYRFLTRLFTVT